MSVITVAWSMVAAACMTLAVVHAMTWFLERRSSSYLLSSLTAMAAAGNAFAELFMLRADTIEVYASAMKWEVFSAGVLLIGLTWFVKVYFGTPRRWLAVVITVSWGLLLIINYFSPFSLVFREVTALRTSFLPWGEGFVYATGTANPWNLPANVLPLVIIAYVVDGSVRLWKRRNRKRAVMIGGSIVFFLFAAGLHAVLVDYGILETPYLISFAYLAIVLAMSYELSRDVVRSAHLAREVSENERRWRSLLEDVKLLVVRLDPKGKVKYVNPYFSGLTGFDSAEIVDQNWFHQVIPETERVQVEAVFKRAIKEGEAIPHSKNAIVDKSGRQLTIQWSNVVLRNPTGEITGSLSIGENVTDRDRAVRELADEREHMNIILFALHTGLALLGPDLTVRWVNERTRRDLDWDDPVGKKCYAFAENREEPCEECGALKAFADGLVHETERLNSLTGRWYHIVSVPIKDESGKVVNVLESSTDITERKIADEALRESESRYRIVADNTYDWEFWLNPQGDYVYVSPSCKKVTGYNPDELSSEAEFRTRLIHPDDLESFNRHMREVEKQKEWGEMEFRIVRKDGDITWISHACQPVYDQDGRYLGVRGSNRDITHRKRAEEARDQAIKELEALKNKLEEENIYLRTEIREVRFFSEIVGESNALLYVLTRVQDVAETDATVLIQGETGVGKELVAMAVHEASARAEKPFVKVNCAALPPNLVESELFGHERGAFTGADRQRKGRFEVADGGTLFFDEISELPLEMQAKLLRVLQDGEFERVGGSQTLRADVRVIAATNHNLSDEVASGRFRADLYYRLNVYPISVPPLRKRRDDIPLLVEHFVPQIASRISKHIDQIHPRMMERLMAYDWPGNIRELRNVLERAIITSTNSVLHLPEGFESESPEAPEALSEEWYSLEEAERRYILRVLEKTGGRVEGPGGAAGLLQLKPSTLRFRINKLGIKRKKTAEHLNKPS